MEPRLQDLENYARQAGKILLDGFVRRPGFGREIHIEHKSEIDLVTEIDHRAEEFILGAIRRDFPQHKIRAEESGVSPGDNHCQWLIDPLDGTVNYAHGVPFFCVSIAFARDQIPRLGVVYDPLLDECFTASQGEGAWLNGEPLRVSATKTMKDSLLVTGFPYDLPANPDNNLDHFAHLSLNAQAVRRLGSAALDLCYIAAGRFDGYWEIRINDYDVAAGGLIAREAGAQVSDFDGNEHSLSSPSIVAANPELHPRILALLHRQ